MPVATCSATCAGPLPSITQAMEGDGLVGSCGAANTAPSGLSAAVTWSAENGSAMGEPACNGPEGGGGAVVVAPPPVVVVDWWRREEVGDGEPDPQAASTSGAASASASTSGAANPNC